MNSDQRKLLKKWSGFSGSPAKLTSLSCCVLTFCIAAGGGIEILLPRGNDENKNDDEVNEKYFITSQTPNQS